ncbi:MAG TPA: TIGR02996 domain-containing protein [Kofleriaceae bacterium]|nr:TIGR02996 domain-containing protein [Kofleriaceae bacterium]
MADDSGASLETAIDDDPDDPAAYSVYGDWLQRRGELRGELIALSLAAEAQHAADPRKKPPAQLALGKLLKKHAAALLGPLARLVADPADPTAPPLIWRHGFIARGELTEAPERPAAPFVGELLRHPSGRFLRELIVKTEGEGPAVIDLLEASAPRSLRELELHALVDLGDLSALWAPLARLERLSLTGRGFELGELRLPQLRRARLAAAELSGSCVRAVARAALPHLERLELRFGGRGADLATFEDLRPLLQRTDLPALTHLKLRRAPYAGSIVRELVGAPLARQLVVLDLSHGSLNPADIEVLVQHKDRFAQLRELWLPLSRLRDQDRRRAMEMAKNVISDARGPQDRLDDEVHEYELRTRASGPRRAPPPGRP